MWNTPKRSSGTRLGHEKQDILAFDTVSLHSNLSSFRRKYLSDIPTDKIVLSFGSKISKRPLNNTLLVAQEYKKENLISGSARGYFWQPFIAPEARKERSCQSFSASRIGLRADSPFRRPMYKRPGLSEISYVLHAHVLMCARY